MKNKIADVIKVFLILLSMVMGFFHIYATVWFLADLPLTYWAMGLVLVIALLSVFGLFQWVVVSADG